MVTPIWQEATKALCRRQGARGALPDLSYSLSNWSYIQPRPFTFNVRVKAGSSASVSEYRMPRTKTQDQRKKLAVPAKEPNRNPEQQPEGWMDTDGLSGEGSESVLAHLRHLERKRRGKPDSSS
jgi:hypothetical protein